MTRQETIGGIVLLGKEFSFTDDDIKQRTALYEAGIEASWERHRSKRRGGKADIAGYDDDVYALRLRYKIGSPPPKGPEEIFLSQDMSNLQRMSWMIKKGEAALYNYFPHLVLSKGYSDTISGRKRRVMTIVSMSMDKEIIGDPFEINA